MGIEGRAIRNKTFIFITLVHQTYEIPYKQLFSGLSRCDRFWLFKYGYTFIPYVWIVVMLVFHSDTLAWIRPIVHWATSSTPRWLVVLLCCIRGFSSRAQWPRSFPTCKLRLASCLPWSRAISFWSLFVSSCHMMFHWRLDDVLNLVLISMQDFHYISLWKDQIP